MLERMSSKESSLVFLHYLTTVFDNIGDAILLVSVEPDEQYRLLMANDAFFRSTGHTPDAIGKPVHEVVSKESYTQIKPRYHHAVTARKPVAYTEWYDVPLGRQAFFVKVIPIMNAVGECVQLAVITRNVTEIELLREENTALKATVRH